MWHFHSMRVGILENLVKVMILNHRVNPFPYVKTNKISNWSNEKNILLQNLKNHTEFFVKLNLHLRYFMYKSIKLFQSNAGFKYRNFIVWPRWKLLKSILL